MAGRGAPETELRRQVPPLVSCVAFPSLRERRAAVSRVRGQFGPHEVPAPVEGLAGMTRGEKQLARSFKPEIAREEPERASFPGRELKPPWDVGVKVPEPEMLRSLDLHRSEVRELNLEGSHDHEPAVADVVPTSLFVRASSCAGNVHGPSNNMSPAGR